MPPPEQPVLDQHVEYLAESLVKLLGTGSAGELAFVRCLEPNVTRALGGHERFAVRDWAVGCVTSPERTGSRLLTADRAVELRNDKGPPLLLLVDVSGAGAGTDSIYNAGREIKEDELFRKANEAALSRLTPQQKHFAQEAIRKVTPHGARKLLSPWRVFDFCTRCTLGPERVGPSLALLGLWPVRADAVPQVTDLDTSSLLVDRLLSTPAQNKSLTERVDGLLLQGTPEQRRELEQFLRGAGGRPLQEVLRELADAKPDLYLHAIEPGFTDGLQRLGPVKLSGLTAAAGGLPEYRVNFAEGSKPATLVVSWPVQPDNLGKGSVEFRVSVCTAGGEELCYHPHGHSGAAEQKERFNRNDFQDLSEGSRVEATVRVSAVGVAGVEPADSEPFLIVAEVAEAGDGVGGAGPVTSGLRVRSLVEGAIYCETEEECSPACVKAANREVDVEDEVILFRPVAGQRSYRAERPLLIRLTEEDWRQRPAAVGRWVVRVRADGSHAGPPEFTDLGAGTCPPEIWEKLTAASQAFGKECLERGGALGRISTGKDPVGTKYVDCWTEALRQGGPELALAQTVEVRDLTGRTLGLIVLPAHPLRVAWRMAYDQLALNARYALGMKPTQVHEALAALDGSSCPALLPGLRSGGGFVFGDALGLHAAAMVADDDPEPRDTVARLAQCLSGQPLGPAPALGARTAEAVAREVNTYLRYHEAPPVLHLHALRPGDGAIVARALGRVLREQAGTSAADDDGLADMSYHLELYPARATAADVGRFLSRVAERRRAGGGVADEFGWMLDSLRLEGNISMPRLRWARREELMPSRPAHLALAFDTFVSRLRAVPAAEMPQDRPLHAFGLACFPERVGDGGSPRSWRSAFVLGQKGLAHPARKGLSEQLVSLHRELLRATARQLGGGADSWPVLHTELGPEQEDALVRLHALSDWVVTVDRHAAIEYFDSPRQAAELYDLYVIDCRPERDDLGNLQMITSTSHQEEVRDLLDGTLGQMGLSSSRRNYEFLLGRLKALSGRLAIRLVSPATKSGELIALALVQAHCASVSGEVDIWLPLARGFFVPLDDVRDLCPVLPPPTEEGGQRADLLYVTLGVGKHASLEFRFVEVKYRRHLRTAREAALLTTISAQTHTNAERWRAYFFGGDVSFLDQAVRRSRLVRVLRFYAEKARRHDLDAAWHQRLLAELDRLLDKNAREPGVPAVPHRGYVFCPEAGEAERIDDSVGDTAIYLFGPAGLPDLLAGAEPPTPSAPPEPAPKAPSAVPRSVSPEPSAPPTPIPSEPPSSAEAVARVIPPPSLAPPEPTVPRDVDVLLGYDVPGGTPVRWTITIKGNPHLMVLGLPGMGKTTCLLNLCAQFVEHGVAPILFSYHEDIDAKLRARLGKAVRFLDHNAIGFNPLAISRPTGTAHIDSAGDLRDIFTAIFPMLGDLQAEAIRSAIKESYERLGWKLNAPNEGLAVPQLQDFFGILKARPKPDKSLQTLLARLQELEDYGVFASAHADQALLEGDGVTVLRVHTAPNDVLQRSFATFMFYKVYKDMFRRGVQERLTHAVVFDEAHRASKLKLLPTMAKECRKFGLCLILASQEVKDFQVSLYSAVANYLALRLTEQDARALAHNVCASDVERQVADRLKLMNRYEAMFFREGQTRPARVRLLGEVADPTGANA